MRDLVTNYLNSHFNLQEGEEPNPIKFANVEGWWWLFVYSGNTQDFIIDIIILQDGGGDEKPNINVAVRSARVIQELPNNNERELKEIKSKIMEQLFTITG